MEHENNSETLSNLTENPETTQAPPFEESVADLRAKESQIDLQSTISQAAPSQLSSESPETEEISTKWNWGAFSLTFFFGIANRAYLGLLILLSAIPWIGWIFGIVWMIIFGLNGEKWALQNPDNHYRDNEEFRKIMDGWNRAGLVAFIIGAAGLVLLILFSAVLFSFLVHNLDQINGNFN